MLEIKSIAVLALGLIVGAIFSIAYRRFLQARREVSERLSQPRARDFWDALPTKVMNPQEQCTACDGKGRDKFSLGLLWCVACGETGRRNEQLRIEKESEELAARFRTRR